MERIKTVTASRGFKVFLLLVLILLFLIPTGMIRGLIYERRERSRDVERDIMKSWGEEYVVQGPVIRIPCKERTEIVNRTSKGEEIEIRESDFDLWIVPEDLRGKTELHTDVKRRGIFSVPLFAGTVRLWGHFDPAVVQKELKPNQEAFPDKAELVIALAGQRGIRGVESAVWNGEKLDFLPGAQGFSAGGEYRIDEWGELYSSNGGGGIFAAAPLTMDKQNSFDIALEVQGGKSLSMVPLGEDSLFELKADWAAPSFQGSYLPVSHTIDDAGFEARWEVSHLSRSIPLAWKVIPERENAPVNFSSSMFGVNFFKALDHYDVNTRAVKYALLFIIIPFLSFFLFEIFLKREIHPVQYLLAGTGNVVFYLLLLSFSEHLPFAAAYGISALAVIVMMSLYSRSILGSWGKSWLMGFITLLCYSFLYFTLQSEDWALLTGSIGIFCITALVMFLTRKIDWSPKQKSPQDHFPGIGEEAVPGRIPSGGL